MVDKRYISTAPDALLAHLAEECAEVQIEAMKCLRFGLHGSHPDQPHEYNVVRLARELNDLAALASLVREHVTRPSIITLGGGADGR